MRYVKRAPWAAGWRLYWNQLCRCAAGRLNRMRSAKRGSIVTILCDAGERYAHSYYNPAWYPERGIDVTASDAAIADAEAGRGLPDLPCAWLE